MNSLNSKIETDFKRDVWCLFGLPVDNITLSGMKSFIHRLDSDSHSVILSTINTNWVVSSLSNQKIRSAIINSDIVCIDGKPLLWLSQLLNYPMKEVVAGSTLIQELNESKYPPPPISIFLFGGEPGVGKQAQNNINGSKGGLHVVGSFYPGFGTIAEMSTDKIINEINATKPDILLVALGATKGAQWIEENHSHLNAKIVSHLGATINFLAGTVQRAPVFFQKISLEWLWRILQEPALFTRYGTDGLSLAKHLIKSLPLWLQYRYWGKQHSRKTFFPITPTETLLTENGLTLLLGSFVTGIDNKHLRNQLCSCAQAKLDIVIDFKHTKFVDGSFLGLLLLSLKWQRKNNKMFTIINCSKTIQKILSFSGIYKSINVKNILRR